jgi:hypothetical protein
MEDFFGGNGYKIIDKNIATRWDNFSNVWGVCDEDMANKGYKPWIKEATTGKPF